ncbi:hypothetical protein [Nocardiopsis sp. MG754419]|uniref:hypothetical protein n=1 Tax=Nocardiopsis sp. MG754419 TaxID=2259865 RepID=UPI001BA783CC|nr:hypothetical protein [Nocardiopsis sp. MG754419]MBR8742606.1 hypothetical protein [Nocardiopsis sp. MG754419]
MIDTVIRMSVWALATLTVVCSAGSLALAARGAGRRRLRDRWDGLHRAVVLVFAGFLCLVVVQWTTLPVALWYPTPLAVAGALAATAARWPDLPWSDPVEDGGGARAARGRRRSALVTGAVLAATVCFFLL